MKWLHWAVWCVVLVAVALVLWWVTGAHQTTASVPSSAIQPSVPAGAVTVPSKAVGASVLVAGLSIQPERDSGKAEPARLRRVFREVQQAHKADDPVAALRKFAEQGNARAANDVGSMLTRCLLVDRDGFRQHLSLLEAKRQNGQLYLDVLQQAPASAASVQAAQRELQRLGWVTQFMHDWKARCRNVSTDEAWKGFRWFERSARMGNDLAGVSFLRMLQQVFDKPAMVGRYPDKAARLRGRALDYLDGLLAQCNSRRLRYYALFMPDFSSLAPYQKYVLAQVAMRPYENSARSAKGTARIREKFAMGALEKRLTTARQQAAARAARAMWARCLGQ